VDLTEGASVADGGQTGETADWVWWEDFVLRGAGFPVGDLSILASPFLASAADELLSQPLTQHALGGFESAWSSQEPVLDEAIARIASGPSFQEAVAWQNRSGLETAVLAIADEGRRTAAPRSRLRQRARLVTRYCQRYSAKNESIGFFGPSGWGRLNWSGETSLSTGTPIVQDQETYFEAWAIDELCHSLEREFDLRPWISPRLNPCVRLEGCNVILLGSRVAVLPAVSAEFLKACDGSRTPKQIAVDLARSGGGLPFDELLAMLDSFASRKWVIWRLEMATSLRPETQLRKILEQIDNVAIKESALERLDRLEAARACAASQPESIALSSALASLDEEFLTITGKSPTRHAGLNYGGRALLYIDSRRNADLVLGDNVLGTLSSIVPILDSVRWLSQAVRQEFYPHLVGTFERLSSRMSHLDATSYWLEALPLLTTAIPASVDHAMAEFHGRWADLLGLDAGAHRVDFELQSLRSRIAESFAAEQPGWQEARYSSPDVMICARSVDDIRAGRFVPVLGEMHPCMNSVDIKTFVARHNDGVSLLAQLERDSPNPRLLNLLPRESPPRLTVRGQRALVRSKDIVLCCAPQLPPPEAGRLLNGSEARVENRDDGLAVVVDDGTEFDLIDLFADALKATLLDRFTFLPAPHRPRVRFDDLVVARECWSFDVSDLEFFKPRNASERFLRARRWQSAEGLPPQVFVKTPGELKPFYVDFASPFLVDLLISSIRSAFDNESGGVVRVTEMLPSVADTWLTDLTGNRYTSEIRLVAFDRKGLADSGA
jgi:Lantibiotic dehydratase, N terminus